VQFWARVCDKTPAQELWTPAQVLYEALFLILTLALANGLILARKTFRSVGLALFVVTAFAIVLTAFLYHEMLHARGLTVLGVLSAVCLCCGIRTYLTLRQQFRAFETFH
jgi:hypothetical protein